MKFVSVFALIVTFSKADEVVTNSTNGEKKVNSTLSLEDEKALLIFQSLVKQKRIEQIAAVKKIMKFKYEQQYKMVFIMLNHTFQTSLENKLMIENSDYVPGSTLTKNDTLREALYHLITCTVLYGEFQLRIPEITDHIMLLHKEWVVLINWLIGFTNATGLFDEKTTKFMHLVSQELDLVERSPDYVNPYRSKFSEDTKMSESAKVSVKKNKPKKTRGPRMWKPKHTEL